MIVLFTSIFILLLSVSARHAQMSHQIQLPTWYQIETGRMLFWRRMVGQPYDLFVSKFNNQTLRNQQMTEYQKKIQASMDSAKAAFKGMSISDWLKNKTQGVIDFTKRGVIWFMQVVRKGLNYDFKFSQWFFNATQKGKNFLMRVVELKTKNQNSPNAQTIQIQSKIQPKKHLMTYN